jgi:hypothetical protein
MVVELLPLAGTAAPLARPELLKPPLFGNADELLCDGVGELLPELIPEVAMLSSISDVFQSKAAPVTRYSPLNYLSWKLKNCLAKTLKNPKKISAAFSGLTIPGRSYPEALCLGVT